jgi:hypothetical protein
VGSDLEPVATLFDAIRGLVGPEVLDVSANATAAPPAWSREERARAKALRLDTFESHINATVGTLNATLSQAPYDRSPLLRQGAILAAKQALFDICAQALEAHCAVLQPALASKWNTLRAQEQSIRAQQEELLAFVEQELVAHVAERARTYSVVAGAEQAQAAWMSEKAELLHAHQVALLRSATRENKSAHRLDTEREASNKEKIALLQRIEQQEAELQHHRRNQGQGSGSSERERALQEQLEQREKYWLEREAAWEMRVQAAQQYAQVAGPQQQSQQQQGASNTSSGLRVNAASDGSRDDGAISGGAYTGSQNLTLHQRQQSRSGPAPPTAQSQADMDAALARLNAPPVVPASLASGAGAGGGGVGGRAMSLRQVKDLIAEIYLSFDLLQRSWQASAGANTGSLRHHESGQNESHKETLLQHMYTFLELKFGLKSLIMDAAASLLRGLQTYAAEHSVAVFAGILRHTLDYRFRHAEAKTRRSVREILRAHLATKHPLKRDAALNALLEAKVSSTGVLSEGEYSAVVSYLFPSGQDRAPILQTIRHMVLQAREAEVRLARDQALTEASRAQAEAMRQSIASVKLAIPYHTFIAILLDFQLAVHRAFLAPFVLVFRQLDTVHSGLLSPGQFARLCLTLNARLSDEDIASRLRRADAFGHGVVSFSDCVAVLQDEITHLAKKQHRIAQGLPAEEEEEEQQHEDEALEEEEEADDEQQQQQQQKKQQQQQQQLQQGSDEDLEQQQQQQQPPHSRRHSHHRHQQRSYDDDSRDELDEQQQQQQQMHAMQQQFHSSSFAAASSPSSSGGADGGDEYDVQPAEVRQAFHVHGQ